MTGLKKLEKKLKAEKLLKTADIVIESQNSDCILMKSDYAKVSGLTLRCTAGKNNKKFYAVDIPQGQLVL
jgi:hypothetical protein